MRANVTLKLCANDIHFCAQMKTVRKRFFFKNVRKCNSTGTCLRNKGKPPIGLNISFRQKYFYSQNGDMHGVYLVGAALYFATQMFSLTGPDPDFGLLGGHYPA